MQRVRTQPSAGSSGSTDLAGFSLTLGLTRTGTEGPRSRFRRLAADRSSKNSLSGGKLEGFIDWPRLWTENPGKKRRGDGVLGTHSLEPRTVQRPERSEEVRARRWGWR